MPFTPTLTVEALLTYTGRTGGFDLEIVAGRSGIGRRITAAAIQKTGLALAGFDYFLHAGRLLVFGESEINYLDGLGAARRHATLVRALDREIPALLVTGGLAPQPEMIAACDAREVPLLRTTVSTPTAIGRLTALLDDRLAPRETVHGVLVDVLGLGVLILGESGIGKSECALDLVVRGHRLVADDGVEVRRRAESVLIGACPELTRHHMEIRGLGLINVRDLFGVSSTRTSKRIELVVQLERWDPVRDYDRLGLDQPKFDILGLAIPMIRMPVGPGRNVAMLVEVAARNQLLRQRGRDAAHLLVERAENQLREAELQDADEIVDLEEDA